MASQANVYAVRCAVCGTVAQSPNDQSRRALNGEQGRERERALSSSAYFIDPAELNIYARAERYIECKKRTKYCILQSTC